MLGDMFSPMFDTQVAFFGIPHGVVLALLGMTGLVVGFLWIRRLVDPDPEVPLFARYPRTRLWQRVSAKTVGVVAVVAIALAVVLKV